MLNREVIGELMLTLEVGNRKTNKFRYIGVKLRQEEKGVMMEQKRYINGIKNVRKEDYGGDRKLTGEEETIYRSLVGQVNWTLQHTRPDLICGVSLASQVGVERSSDNMRKLGKLVERAKEYPLEIRMARLCGNKWIETYTDASYGNRKKGSSQVGFVVAIGDECDGKCPFFWKSRKGKRIARSTLEAEAISLNEGLEMAIYIREMWKELSGGEEVKIVGKTDSRTLERAIHSNMGVSSRKMIIM